jgi:hypothetical protein
VLDDVVAHRRDAIRGLHDLIDPRGSLGHDAGLALVEALGFGQLGEGLVERVVVDVEVNETGLDVDRERRPVGDLPLYRVCNSGSQVLRPRFTPLKKRKFLHLGSPCFELGRQLLLLADLPLCRALVRPASFRVREA